MPPEQLLELLPPHLKDQFLSAINSDPGSSSLLQTLLSSPALQDDASERPWWINDESSNLEANDEVESAGKRPAPKRLILPQGLEPSKDVAEKMIYNILSIT